MKKGLVMEGGGMRGLFTAGIIDVFMEEGVDFDGAVGVSAGATFGCNIKSKQPGRAIRYNLKYCKDPRYGSFASLILTGDMFETKWCYGTLPEKLDPMDFNTFAKNPMEFYCVVTNAMTGDPVYKRLMTARGEEMQWIRASASIPLVSRMVKIKDGYYCDGGSADSIPLKFFEGLGYEKNVVILTRDINYRKGPDKMAKLYPILLKKYPGAASSLAARPEMYNEERDYVERKGREGKAFVIVPPEPITIKRMESDPEKLKYVYELGRKTAKQKLADIKAYLSDEG